MLNEADRLDVFLLTSIAEGLPNVLIEVKFWLAITTNAGVK